MFLRIIDKVFHTLPAPKVSFKFRLTFWYSFFATVTLLIFIAIVYYSATEEVQDSLRDNILPTAKDLPDFSSTVPAYLFQHAYWQDGKVMRVLFYRSNLLQITIAYAIDEVRSTLNELFSLMLYLLPLIFFVSLAGGWWLASYSLQPIEKITQTAREITARRLDQRITLNDMIARLEASFQQIRQFTSDVSHELRTPLSILMGELELALRSRRSPEEYEQILSTALEEVIRLSKLVQNLLELSRAETGQINLTMEQLDLSLLLHDIVEDAEILAEAKNIQVHSSIETPLWIRGDKHRLYQAFLNLVDNAVKYTPENQTIAIRGARQGQNVVVEIEDTGIGIPAKDIPFIFRRFYRVDKARSRKIQGQGLGLAIVQWIIHSHGGEIQVESTPGKGSCFRIILPVAQPKTVATDAATNIPSS